MKEIIERASHIKLLALDVDGILTDGRLYFSESGHEIKSFYVHDGLGIKSLLKANIHVAIISSRESVAVTRRFESLMVLDIYQGQENKLPAFEALQKKYGLTDKQIAYMGDDLPDLPLLKRAGLAVTVPNAHAVVKEIAHWQTEKAGGCGAVRELCDFILNAQR